MSAPTREQDILDLPSYQAMKAVNDLTLGERLAALKRQFGAMGTLRGTPAIQAMTNAAGEATTRMGQLIPDMLQTAWGREQQNVGNMRDLLNAQLGIENTGFNQGLSEFNATAPYRYQTVAGQTAADQWAQQFPITEAGVTGMYQGKKTPQAGLIEAQTAQARASANKTVAPKEADYQKQFVQGAYLKLINGQSLTDDERRALKLNAQDTDDIGDAVKAAQNDPKFEDLDMESRLALIQQYADAFKRLRGKNTSKALPAARSDVYLGATDGMTDEEIYRMFGM
jgi:hypothetical protein